MNSGLSVALALILLLAGLACSHRKTYPLQGEVRGKYLATNEVTVNHGDIPKLDAARFALEAEMPSTPGALEATTTLRSAQAEITREQREKAKPKPHKFALIAVVKSY